MTAIPALRVGPTCAVDDLVKAEQAYDRGVVLRAADLSGGVGRADLGVPNG